MKSRSTALAGLILAVFLYGCSGARAMGDEPVNGAADADEAYADAMAREHADDEPIPNEPDVEPDADLSTREVVYGTVDGRELRGYLATPVGVPATAPALIVIHEWWGLNDGMRLMARRLAAEGYRVLAVDLFGEATDDPARAREQVGRVMQNPDAAVTNLRAAASYLRESGSTRLGLIGWCFGGGWSLRGGLALGADADAVVMYYGPPVTEPDLLARLEAPLLGIFGGADEGIALENVREMEGELNRLDHAAEIHIYEGADHAFANPSGGNYDATAAADAWRETTDFLKLHLQPAG